MLDTFISYLNQNSMWTELVNDMNTEQHTTYIRARHADCSRNEPEDEQ